MWNPPRILVADDSPENRDILRTRLTNCGYEVVLAKNGEEALQVAETAHPDLVLLDVMMPKIDGIEVCRRLKANEALPFMPVIMVTAKADSRHMIEGLEAGADEYLTKPVDQASLVARVRSMLRIKNLQDTTQQQALRLETQAGELAQWNARLEERLAEQRRELERVGHLKRFFSPQVADYILSSGDGQLMKSHRQEITVVFCDLRGFTAFAEAAEPEEVMQTLVEFHDVVGPLAFQFGATLEHIVGDGLTAFFNDPVPCDDPAAQAARMAVEMRREVNTLIRQWHKRGFELGFGMGIAMGYATLGQIGFEGQFHYGAIGSVLNLASRLCDSAESGQILITRRVYADIESLVEVTPLGEFTLKGFHKPVTVFNVTGLATENVSEQVPEPAVEQKSGS